MAPPKHDTLTPIRIRGKRRGTPAEKWHHGKRRKQELQKRLTPSDLASSATPHTSTSRPRERKRRDAGEESRLELLPAEVIQLIFEYSANIDLPLVSRTLASKLSKSQHLQHQLVSEILRPVLGHASAPAKADLCRATRLLNSKFVTWQFFTSWLRSHVASNGDSNEAADDLSHWVNAWASLEPLSALLPPKKLLSPPNGYTQETVDFLAVLAHGVDDLPRRDPAYGELAYDGLVQAVREDRAGVVSQMLKMGVQVSTETLRVAVAECGCNEDIICMLLCRPDNDDRTQMSSSLPETHGTGAGAIDLLDPEIWAWADKAERQGNKRGEWLVAELRNVQQQRSSISET